MELSKRYQPADVEAKNYRFWEEGDYFRASVGVVGKVPFSIVIPPPNVTGRLHMGHALNNTLQDVVIRYRRMVGDEACWFPGTDHAGIATQNVVEKDLAKEGTTRHQLGRDAFVARVWDWKAKYGSEIIDQLKALGCSCDWSRLRFTLDEGLSKAVRHVFVRLYEEGLVYRGEYLVNWCPRCRTALSDLEVGHRDVDGGLYYIRYPLEKGGCLTIATTRPETMLGDTAIAVHPQDQRYQHLIGTYAILPILGRRLPIVGSESVDPEFGTGTLKVTPAHDPVDFEIGKKEGLESINILNGDGTLNEAAGPFAGMEREAAQRAVVERLKADGALEKIEPYRHAVGHCDRCDAAVEPLLSTQWFVRMRPLAEKAIAAVKDGRIQFVPERWTKLYFDWLENIRDWCISRQLWWGHRIPVWYGPDGREFVAETEEEAAARARKHYARSVELRQDEDVLDTWFSSWLWPFSVMGWPEKTEDLATFFPTSFLLTGFDILFFWVSRMVMASLCFMDDVPFRTVYITPLIVDDKGQKMSKSKGNSVDPIDLIGEYGADALRLAMAQTTGKGRTVRMPWGDLTEGRNFLNKIWNMARFVLMNLGDERPALPDQISWFEDRYILRRLSETTEAVRKNLEEYGFHLAVETLYGFTWHDVCDWYVEMAKPRIAAGDPVVRGVLYHLLRETTKLLHPFVPFITEEIWQALGEAPASVCVASYPSSSPRDPDESDVWAMTAFQGMTGGVRSIRAEWNVPATAELRVVVKADPRGPIAPVVERLETCASLTGPVEYDLAPDAIAPKGSARVVLQDLEMYVPLAGVIDLDSEAARIKKELSEMKTELDRSETKLSNEQFLKRAPEDVVEKERAKQAEFRQKRDRLQANLSSLGG
ncbi:MAG: valine--tRNA ligase [Candidatus Bipolaricaulis sp.]|nr:valine--tRNA ligase [Candidatus Bipolaricaulis sp.]